MAIQINTILLLVIGVFLNPASWAATPDRDITYGNAQIKQVNQITADFILVCDILDYPAVVGLGMPVKIRGLDCSGDIPRSALHKFLKSLLLTDQNDPNQVIQMKNIQRGNNFCFIADIYVNGRDLGDYLISEGLVDRILKIPSPPSANTPASKTVSDRSTAIPDSYAASRPVPPSPPQKQAYVASKSSKIFHRSDCPHAKRIAEEQKIYFSTPQQAIATGRRPCKTCKP